MENKLGSQSHLDSIWQRIQRHSHYQRCWWKPIPGDMILCCDSEYPEGQEYIPIGTYDKRASFSQFIEDCRFARENMEPL